MTDPERATGPDRPAGGLPVVSPPFEGDRTEAEVVGVVLAAGTSSRFGDANKLLATVDGEPLVRHATRTLVGVLDAVVVVVGHEADRIADAIGDLDVRVVENPDYEQGQSTSVRRGALAAVESGTDDAGGLDAVVFALGDVPGVSPRTVRLLVDAFEAGVGSALAAAHEGERGNPVLFGARHLDALADVDGDAGGRSVLLDADDAALVETGDPGVLADVDIPDDLPDAGG